MTLEAKRVEETLLQTVNFLPLRKQEVVAELTVNTCRRTPGTLRRGLGDEVGEVGGGGARQEIKM